RIYAALNRKEVPPTTLDVVSVDHRRVAAFAPGDMIPYIRATWDVAPDVSIYVEAVHRLSNRGAVVTNAVHGISQEGFEAEWREIATVMLDGDLIDHCEMYDQTDLDAALTRFDELHSSPPRLENAATHTLASFADAFNRRDMDGYLALLAEDGRYEDRRKGLRDEGTLGTKLGRAVFSEAPNSWRWDVEPIAIRGSRLALTRDTWRDTAETGSPIAVETVMLTEVDRDKLISHAVVFDAADMEAAFSELDARYLAGDAAAHAPTWSATADAYAALNRRELPATTPDWVNIDHRHV